MTRHNTRRAGALMAQATELALAVPQVVAHRLARMAMAGASPSAVDQAEFKLMGDEKMDAFRESWTAMAAHTLKLQQQMAVSAWQACFFPWTATVPTMRSVERQFNNASLGVLGKGLEPIRRRAVANARRLATL